MTTAASSLQYRVKLLEPARSVDAVGAPVEIYTEVAAVWAKRRGAFAAERMSADERVARADAVFTLRRSALTEGITARWRIESEGEAYDILSVDPSMDERRRRSIEIRAHRRADT